jgi:hypothetical protein
MYMLVGYIRTRPPPHATMLFCTCTVLMSMSIIHCRRRLLLFYEKYFLWFGVIVSCWALRHFLHNLEKTTFCIPSVDSPSSVHLNVIPRIQGAVQRCPLPTVCTTFSKLISRERFEPKIRVLHLDLSIHISVAFYENVVFDYVHGRGLRRFCD